MIEVMIRVKGLLDPHWSEWFDGFSISHSGQYETVLAGFVPDQGALYGVLIKMRNLGLALISVHCVESDHANADHEDH